MRVTSPQRTILCVHTKREGANDSIQSSDSICIATLLPGTGERVHVDFRWICSTPLLLELKLCRDIRVMTANQRSTAWPLSDVRYVTANQFSTGQPFPAVQSGLNRSIEEKVIVAVCDSPSSI